MEKLNAAQQQQLKKMSDERLRVKLISAGFDEDVVFGMERAELIATYAELLASGKLKVSPGAVGWVAYDPEVEKEKLDFEKQKWEAEQRKWEAEMEIRKQETEERRRKEEKEDDIVKLLSITKAVPKLKFICFDIANGHMERFCDVIGEARKTFPQHTIMVFIFCITVIWSQLCYAALNLK